MPGETRNGMQCAEFDALLSEALDETLAGQKLETFQAHARVCSVCGPLFADAEAGKHWLNSLEEIEVPANLVHNILVATSGQEHARRGPCPSDSWKETLTGWRANRSFLGEFASPGSSCHSAWPSSHFQWRSAWLASR